MLYKKERFNREAKIGLLIFLLTVIVYANSLFNSFVWDDRYLIVENNLTKNWRSIPKFFTTQLYQGSGQDSNFYRPTQKFSVFLDYSIWKLKPFGYHISNILIHALNAVLVYILLNLLFKRKDISLISSMLFAVHPIHTQAVTYISGRSDLLAGLFIFSSLILFIKHRKHSDIKKYYWGAVLCFILALLSKESAVIFPFILILYDISFNRNIVPITPQSIPKISGCLTLRCPSNKEPPCFKTKDCLSDYLPFLLLISVYIILRLTVLNFSTAALWTNKVNFYLRVITFGKVLFSYIRLLFLPLGLHMQYASNWAVSFFQPQILISNILLFLILLVMIGSYKYSKMFFFAIAWFLLTLIPVSNIVPLNAVIAEHWLYIPSVGFFVIFSLGMVKLAGSMKMPLVRKSFLFFSLVSILTGYSALTIVRNRNWKDEMTLYQDILKYSPNNAKVHNQLGIVYKNIGDYEKAVKEFDEAIRLKPDFAEPYSNLGNVYQIQKHYEQAIEIYEKAIALNPNFSLAYNNLAGVYILLGKYDKAIEECERALFFREDYPEAHNNIGTAYGCKGEFEKAAKHYKRAIEINPGYIDAYTNLAAVYNVQKNYLEVTKILKEAIRLKPKSAKLHNELGIAYKNLGEYEKAIQEYKTALKLDPEYVQSYNNLGIIYSIIGEHEEAIKLYKKTIALNPFFSQPYKLLGMAYLEIKDYRLAEEYFKQAEKLGLPVQEYLDEIEMISTDTGIISKDSKIK